MPDGFCGRSLSCGGSLYWFFSLSICQEGAIRPCCTCPWTLHESNWRTFGIEWALTSRCISRWTKGRFVLSYSLLCILDLPDALGKPLIKTGADFAGEFFLKIFKRHGSKVDFKFFKSKTLILNRKFGANIIQHRDDFFLKKIADLMLNGKSIFLPLKPQVQDLLFNDMVLVDHGHTV